MSWIYKLQKSKKTNLFLKVMIIILIFLYIFLIPAFGESSSTLVVLVYLTLILLFLVTFFYSLLYKDFKIPKSALFIPAFAIFALLGTLIYSHSYRRWFSLVLLAVSFFVFLQSFKILKNKMIVMHIISLALLCFSVLFIFHYRNEIIHFKDFASGTFRLGNYFDNPNGVAAYEVVGFSASLFVVLFSHKKMRFVHVVPLLLSIIVGISTGSRSYIIAVAVITIIMLYFVFKKHKLIYLIIVAALLVSFIGFLQLPFMWTLRDRLIIALGTIFGFAEKVETSTLTRTIWLDYGFYLGFKNGITGYGADGFAIFSGVGTYTHNNYAEVICDFGYIGLLLFYGPLIFLLIKAIVNPKIEKSLVISFVIYYLVISISNVLYYKKMYYMVLALLYYIVYFETKEANKRVSALNSILFACDSMNAGGAERVIASLSNEFVQRNIKVTIVGVSDAETSGSFYRLDNRIKYIALRSNKNNKNFIKRIFSFNSLILKEKPDIIISFLPHVNSYVWLASFFNNTPFIVSERNDPMHIPTDKKTRLLNRAAFSMADGCVFQTKGAMNFYKDSIAEKGIVIPNPCIINDSNRNNRSNDQKKKAIVSVGRLEKQKNQKLLIESFAKANRQLEHLYVLKIYGEGSLKDELVNLTKTLGIDGEVVFCGNNSKWQEIERNSSLFILSSDFEGMPNALLEALSIGLPCISTDCPSGGPKQFVEDGFNLNLVPINSVDAMADEIVAVLNKYGKTFDQHNIEHISIYDTKKVADYWINYILGL